MRYDGPLNPFARGDATVTYRIHNTGNAALSGQQAVSVSGPFGLLRARAGAVAATPELLPGESWTVTLPVHGVAPALRLAATATLTPLLTDASGSTTSLKPGAGHDARLGPAVDARAGACRPDRRARRRGSCTGVAAGPGA